MQLEPYAHLGKRPSDLGVSFALAWLLLCGVSTARAELAPGNCPPQDLEVTLNTGWNENAEAVIASGSPDDDWSVILDPASGPTPRDADVVTPSSAWLTLPNSTWISSADSAAGPNGTYIYETCWCMDDSFTSPNLSFAIRADDQADVLLNGSIVLTLPEGTFNDPTAIGISVVDPTKFFIGLNCLNVRVKQLHGGPHGFNLTGSVTAVDGRCCGCFDLPPDAEAWWPLDETAGTTASDIVNGHDGTYSGSGLPPTPAPGKVAGSLSFNGADDYVEAPDHPGLDFDATTDLTIDAWILTTSGLREPIVNKKVVPFNAPGYTFFVGSGVLGFEMADGTATIVCNGGGGLNDGGWHFVAVTLDRDDPLGLKLYIDALPPTTCNPTAVGSMVNAEPFLIGARPSPLPGAMWWQGRLDEIEVFRRALTPTEIHEIFAAGGAGKCPPEPPPPCEQSGYPSCNGTCPPGERCTQGPNVNCACVAEPQACGDPGDYPTCNGPCPQGLVCDPVPGTQTCACVEEFPACGNTFYPECGGVCPPGDECVNVFGTNNCTCQPLAAACGDPLYPACNGACPVNQKCVAREAPVPGCECTACATLGPSGLGGITLGWPATKDQLRWKGAADCALVYNIYRAAGPRLRDLNADGLADDYGSCWIGDIIGNDAPDPSPPPGGQVHWYLITAENFIAEGSLGTNSHQLERPNLSPCP